MLLIGSGKTVAIAAKRMLSPEKIHFDWSSQKKKLIGFFLLSATRRYWTTLHLMMVPKIKMRSSEEATKYLISGDWFSGNGRPSSSGIRLKRMILLKVSFSSRRYSGIVEVRLACSNGVDKKSVVRQNWNWKVPVKFSGCPEKGSSGKIDWVLEKFLLLMLCWWLWGLFVF